MTIKEYQTLAQRTSPDDGHDRALNGKLGLIGEAGEVVDVVKKWMFQSDKGAELPTEKLIEEIGDVLWYCAEYCAGNGTTIMEQMPTYWRCNSFALADAVHELAEYAVKADISKVLIVCEALLRRWCWCTLEQAMDNNIAKLKRRYPDGFEVSRSEHRTE